MISLILWFEKLAVPNGHTYPSVTHSDHLRMQYKYFYSFNLCVIFSSICYVVETQYICLLNTTWILLFALTRNK